MNEVVMQGKGKDLMDPTNTYNPFAAAAEEMGANQGAFMRFGGNSGDYTVGEDEVPIGTRFAVDAMNTKHGWVCWKDSAPVDKVLIRVIDGPMPAEDTLKDHGPYDDSDDSTEGWGKTYAFTLISLISGETFTFEIGAQSSITSLGKFLKEYGSMFRQHPNQMPVVELSSGNYMPKDKKRGRKHFAVFNIVDWIDTSEVEAAQGRAASAAPAAQEGADDPSNYAQAVTTPAVVDEKATVVSGEQKPTGRSSRAF